MKGADHRLDPGRVAPADLVAGPIDQPWSVDKYADALASVTGDPVTRREFEAVGGALRRLEESLLAERR